MRTKIDAYRGSQRVYMRSKCFVFSRVLSTFAYVALIVILFATGFAINLAFFAGMIWVAVRTLQYTGAI